MFYDSSFTSANTEKILCRICEQHLNVDIIEDHLRTCVIEQEFAIKKYSNDIKLKKMSGIISKLQERTLKVFEEDSDATLRHCEYLSKILKK
jgi:hypothetical protein